MKKKSGEILISFFIVETESMDEKTMKNSNSPISKTYKDRKQNL